MSFKHRFLMALALWLAACALGVYSVRAQAINPSVTQANIHETICVKSWTKTVRPSSYYTNKIKKRLMKEQGIPLADMSKYELDHIIPLDLGGAPRDPANMMLQPWSQADKKDGDERRMKNLVCKGTLTLENGQQYFVTQWRKT